MNIQVLTSKVSTRGSVIMLGCTMLILASLTHPAQASGSAEAGKAKAATCAACHGDDGLGTSAEFPILAGQYVSYLEQALTQYRDGSRKNAIMSGFSAGLSDQDIKDLAAFYAAKKSSLGTPKP